MSRILRSKVFWGALVLVVLAVVAVGVCAGRGPRVPADSWLVVDLRSALTEYDPPADLMGQLLGERGPTLQQTLDNLAKATADRRIKGVLIMMSASSAPGGASRDELREALAGVRAAGKRVVTWAEGLNPAGVHLAAASDTVTMCPTGWVIFTGSQARSMHVRGLLDKLGVKADLHKIKDYKSVAEMMTRTDMSDPARENRAWLLQEAWDMVHADLANDRGLDEDAIVSLMERAVLSAEEALQGGLIDQTWYWDQLETELGAEPGKSLPTVSQSTYSKVRFDQVGLAGKHTVAVIHAQGMIGGRKSRINPLLGMMIGHETVVADLRRAQRDPKVKAVILRVDSPGGDALASDLIARQIDIMRADKPVVVSMVDVAASGGYVIAYRADKVVANPLTITGSIGSISGKFNLAGLYDRLGISFDQISKGPMADFYSDLRDFTPEERARFEENHWASFNRWLADVAERRGMTFAEAEQLAHGRVWTGRQAVANNLVDELGGLQRAVQVAKDLAGIPAEERVRVVHFPERRGLLQLLRQGDGDGSTSVINWMVYRLIHRDLAEAARLLADGRLQWEPAVPAL